MMLTDDDPIAATLLPADFESAERMHDALSRQLGFPDYYGRNFDALFDALMNRNDAVLRIAIVDPARAFEIGGGLAAAMCAVIQDAAGLVVFQPEQVELVEVDHQAFAAEWVDAWNSKDLERVLAHYADDVVLTSPLAARVVPASNGTIRGKAALRAYWTEALAKTGALHFTLEDVLSGAGTITILYRNHRAERVTETLVFDGAGLVARVVVAYRAVRAEG
jgi:RNAse (barnase) inhibitor barstar/ketosteroid isomerase-like protein